MRNNLPKNGPRRNEAAIVNLDDETGPGTHWVAYKKHGNDVNYFESFGNLQPPREIVNYFGVGSIIRYNHDRYQDFPNSLVRSFMSEISLQ